MGTVAQSPGANDPILIAVIGKAASGKSSFVNAVLGKDLALVGASGIGSCTQHMASYHHLLPDGRDLIIVDTPGFDGYIPLEDGEAPGRIEILKMLEGYLGTRSTARRHFSYILVLESAQDEEPMSALSSTIVLGRIIEGARVVLVSTHWDLALPEDEGEAKEREGSLHADDSLSRYLMDTVEDIQLRRSGRQDEGDVVLGYISPRDLIFDLVGVAEDGPAKDVIVQAPTVDITGPVQAAPTTTTTNSLEQVDASAASVASIVAQKLEEAFSRLKLPDFAIPPCPCRDRPDDRVVEDGKGTEVERLVREAVAREKATLSTEVAMLKCIIDGMQREQEQCRELQAQKQTEAVASMLAEVTALLAGNSLPNGQRIFGGSITIDREIPPPLFDEERPNLLDGQFCKILHKTSGRYLTVTNQSYLAGFHIVSANVSLDVQQTSGVFYQGWDLYTENNGRTWRIQCRATGYFLVPESAGLCPTDACRLTSKQYKDSAAIKMSGMSGIWKIFRPKAEEDSFFIRLVDHAEKLTPWALTVGAYPAIDKWTGTQEQLWQFQKV